MIGKRRSEGAIRVGAEGAEWLAWRLNAESLVTGRMTSSFSAEAALEQWMGRAERFGMKPRRVWLIAGADSCAHRRLVLQGTDRSILAQAIPFAVAEEMPLPLDQMWWTYSTQLAPDGQSTYVDVVATPRALFTEWEEILQDRRLEIAGRIPEGPLLWRELAAIRGSELELLAVWGERRASIIRGNEQGMSALQAFVRGPGESWESLLNDLRRPFQNLDPAKPILSVFTADRLRKRILSLEELVPANSENLLTRDIFHAVPEEVAVAVSLLAMRRLRLEKRMPNTVFAEVDRVRPAAVDIREVAKSLDIPFRKVAAIAALLALAIYLGWFSHSYNQERAADQMLRRALLKEKQAQVENRVNALRDAERYFADWGSVWLELSQRIPEKTLFKDLTYGVGAGIRINGNTGDQESLAALDRTMRSLEFFEKIRIQKTELADDRLHFQIFADFNGSKVKRYEVKDPFALGVGSASEEKRGAKGSKDQSTPKPDGKGEETPRASGPKSEGGAES